MKTFATIVEEVKNLSIEEKQDLHLLLDKILVEARRDELLSNHQQSMSELKEGKIKFYLTKDEGLVFLLWKDFLLLLL